MAGRSTRRKFLTSTGAAAVGISLAGCLGDDDGNGGNGGDGDTPTDEEFDFEGPSGDFEVDEEVEIDWLYSIGGLKGQVTAEIADMFNQESDTITVNAVHEGDYGDVWNATLQGIRADDPPAIAHLNANHTLMGLAEDAFVPVEQVMGDRMDHDDFLDAAGAYYIIDDELIGLPFAMSTVVAHYNVDAFEEAGLPTDPEEVPLDTFEDYRETSQQLMDEGVTPHGATWPNHAWFYESWFANQFQDFVNQDNGRSGAPTESHLTSEAGQRLFGWIKDMYDNDEYLLSGGWGDARQAYVNEEVAILIDSSSNVVEMTEGAEESGFESTVGTVPSYDEWNGLVIGGGALFVPRGLPDLELQAAAEFLLYMARPEIQAHFHSNTGYYPVSREAEQLLVDDGTYDEQPELRRAFEQLLDTEPGTPTDGALMLDHPQVRDEVVDGATRIFQGTPVEQALEQTKDEVDGILEGAAQRDPRND